MITLKNKIHIKRIKEDNLRQSLLNILGLIEEFILNAKEHERNVDSIVFQICGLEDIGALWIIYNGSIPIGYFFVQIMHSEYNVDVCVVHQVYIQQKYADKKLAHTVDAIIGAWARVNQCKEIVFFTRRDPHAFIQYLKGNWKLDSYILKRNV